VPRASRRPWLWILALVPISIVASLLALVGLGALFNFTGKDVALEEGERSLVLDISHLAEWMPDYTPDPAREKVTKRRYIDDSSEIEYVYDVPDQDDAPYLSYTLSFEPSEGDASTTYLSYWGGTRIAFYAFGEIEVDVSEKNDLFRWGDESRFALLSSAGAPFGNVFVAKKGRTVVYLIVSGIYFDDAENASGLLTPYLEKLETHVAEK
jgi:hypothetical protein